MGAGGSSIPVGGAHVRLWVKDAEYYRALARAQSRLTAWAATANAAGRSLGLGPAVASVRALDANLHRMNTTLARSVSLARSLRGIMAGMPGMPSVGAVGTAWGRIITGFGEALRRTLLGVGGAGGSLLRGLGGAAGRLGSGLGMLLGRSLAGGGMGGGALARGVGGAIASGIRSTAPVIRAFGSTFSMVIRTSMGLLRGLPSLLMAPFRMLASPLGLLGVAGGAFGAFKAVRAMQDAEDTMFNLQRITGGTRREAEGLVRSFQQMASYNPGVPLESYYDVGGIGARMGISNPSELRQFTSDMTKFASILDESDISLTEATERIGSMISVFRLGHTDAIRFGSALLRLDAASVATARDILDVANRFSGPAAVFGMKPDQTLALATALRQAKVPVETAGTSMGQILMRMASRRDQPAFARMAGMNARQFRGTLDADPMQAIAAVTQGLARIEMTKGPVAASQALDRLHLDGQRVRSTMIQLAQVLPELNRYLGISSNEWKTASMVNQGFAARAETLSAQLDLMVNRFKLLAVSLGNFAMPAIKGFSAGMANLVGDVTAFTERAAPTLQAWGQRFADTFGRVGAMLRNPGTTKGWLVEEGKFAFEQIGSVAKNVFTNVIAFIGDAFSKLWRRIKFEFGLGMRDALREVAFQLEGSMLGMLSSPLRGISNFFEGMAASNGTQTGAAPVTRSKFVDVRGAGSGGLVGAIAGIGHRLKGTPVRTQHVLGKTFEKTFAPPGVKPDMGLLTRSPLAGLSGPGAALAALRQQMSANAENVTKEGATASARMFWGEQLRGLADRMSGKKSAVGAAQGLGPAPPLADEFAAGGGMGLGGGLPVGGVPAAAVGAPARAPRERVRAQLWRMLGGGGGAGPDIATRMRMDAAAVARTQRQIDIASAIGGFGGSPFANANVGAGPKPPGVTGLMPFVLGKAAQAAGSLFGGPEIEPGGAAAVYQANRARRGAFNARFGDWRAQVNARFQRRIPYSDIVLRRNGIDPGAVGSAVPGAGAKAQQEDKPTTLLEKILKQLEKIGMNGIPGRAAPG